MKVAFCTSTGLEIDQSFRNAASYTVWDIGPRDSYYVHTVFAPEGYSVSDDEIAARAESLRECAIVCSREVNRAAAAKLVSRRVHLIECNTDTPVEDFIGRLQEVLRAGAPPWLCKELLKTPWLLFDSHIWQRNRWDNPFTLMHLGVE